MSAYGYFIRVFQLVTELFKCQVTETDLHLFSHEVKPNKLMDSKGYLPYQFIRRCEPKEVKDVVCEYCFRTPAIIGPHNCCQCLC